MKSPIKYSTLLTDLDCIFDTRLGTLVNIDKDIADKVFEQNLYFNRLEDSFLTIDKETFYDYYSKRNKLILANSPLTRVMQFIKEFILGTLKNAINSPFKYDPKIIVNVHPYVLTDDEKRRILRSISYIINESAVIEIVDLPLVDITPQFIKSSISIWLSYEYSQWLEHYANNKVLETVLMPDVSLLVPAIFFHHLPTNKERAEFAKNGLEPFQALELMAKPIINLKVLKVSTFSIDPQYYDNDNIESDPIEDSDSKEDTETIPS